MIGLFFGGLLKRLLGAVAALFGTIRRHPWQAAVIALLALSAFMWRGKANALDERDLARAETAQLIVTYRNAQKEAEAAQIAANKAHEAATARTARKADHDYQIALDGARSAASRYADANRVRGQTACRPARVASALAQDGTPEDRDGQGDLPDMVAVSRDDFTTLTDNTIRLQAVHDWGEALIREGKALPEVGF